MTDTIKDRLLKIAEIRGISVRKLESDLSLNRGNISNIPDNGSIGSDKLAKILDSDPTISPDWLISGRGEMFRSQVQNVNGHHNTATMNGDIHQSTGDNDTQRLDSLLEANRKLIDQHAELIRQQGELIEIIKSMTKDTLQK